MKFLILLAPLIFTACGQGGGSQAPAGGRTMLTLTSGKQVYYDDKTIGWSGGQFNVGACTFETKVIANANPDAFEQKTFEVTSPVNPACANELKANGGTIGGFDQTCTLYGQRLECCLTYGDPNDPNTCYDWN